MPLDGASPIVMPTDTVSGEQQNVIRPKQTVVDGCPVLPKIQCHEVQMGQDARLLWNFKNPQGDQVDLIKTAKTALRSLLTGLALRPAGSPCVSGSCPVLTFNKTKSTA